MIFEQIFYCFINLNFSVEVLKNVCGPHVAHGPDVAYTHYNIT